LRILVTSLEVELSKPQALLVVLHPIVSLRLDLLLVNKFLLLQLVANKHQDMGSSVSHLKFKFQNQHLLTTLLKEVTITPLDLRL
jgi:hypothetical protein